MVADRKQLAVLAQYPGPQNDTGLQQQILNSLVKIEPSHLVHIDLKVQTLRSSLLTQFRCLVVEHARSCIQVNQTVCLLRNY